MALELNEYTLSKKTQGAPDSHGGLLTLTSSTTRNIIPPGVTDRLSESIPIGFSFSLASTPVDCFVVCGRGWVKFAGAGAITASEPTQGYASSDSVIFFPWWERMQTSGSVKTCLSGSSGSYVRVIEWTCYGSASDTSVNYDIVSFQVALYEADQSIEFRYSGITHVASGGSGYGGACGVKQNSSSGTSGNVRDFFGSGGSPAGSAAPFTSNLKIWTGGSYDWPGASGNSLGYAYNFRLAPPSASGPNVVLAEDAPTGHTIGTTFFLDETVY